MAATRTRTLFCIAAGAAMFSAATQASGCTVFTVSMSDSYGDGWGYAPTYSYAAIVTSSDGGTNWGTLVSGITLTGSFPNGYGPAYTNFTIPSGTRFAVTFTSLSGLSPSEIRFKAYDSANGGGNLLYDFTAGPPTLGTKYYVPALITNTYVTASATLDINSGSTTTYNSVFSGIGSIVKDGSGTLVLSGANTHTMGTTVKSGILDVPVSNSIASGTVTVQVGGTLRASNVSTSTPLVLNSSLILSGGSIQIG